MKLSDYDAIVSAPCTGLGIVIENGVLVRIEFLPLATQAISPRNAIARKVCAELQAYLHDPAHPFALPMLQIGTPFQRKVWQALSRIPVGTTLHYGDLAREIGSSARAVGQACGANPLPIVVPCHRVVAKNSLGGFMHSRDGNPLSIKHWLLDHEARVKRSA
jgi:methylated-DNA-[protein]-cysteine S-methyltransferase